MNGTVSVTLYATCGWSDKTSLSFSVKDASSIKALRQTVYDQHWEDLAEMSKAWHKQAGLEGHGCVCSFTLDWEEV